MDGPREPVSGEETITKALVVEPPPTPPNNEPTRKQLTQQPQTNMKTTKMKDGADADADVDDDDADEWNKLVSGIRVTDHDYYNDHDDGNTTITTAVETHAASSSASAPNSYKYNRRTVTATTRTTTTRNDNGDLSHNRHHPRHRRISSFGTSRSAPSSILLQWAIDETETEHENGGWRNYNDSGVNYHHHHHQIEEEEEHSRNTNQLGNRKSPVSPYISTRSHSQSPTPNADTNTTPQQQHPYPQTYSHPHPQIPTAPSLTTTTKIEIARTGSVSAERNRNKNSSSKGNVLQHLNVFRRNRKTKDSTVTSGGGGGNDATVQNEGTQSSARASTTSGINSHRLRRNDGVTVAAAAAGHGGGERSTCGRSTAASMPVDLDVMDDYFAYSHSPPLAPLAQPPPPPPVQQLVLLPQTSEQDHTISTNDRTMLREEEEEEYDEPCRVSSKKAFMPIDVDLMDDYYNYASPSCPEEPPVLESVGSAAVALSNDDKVSNQTRAIETIWKDGKKSIQVDNELSDCELLQRWTSRMGASSPLSTFGSTFDDREFDDDHKDVPLYLDSPCRRPSLGDDNQLNAPKRSSLYEI